MILSLFYRSKRTLEGDASFSYSSASNFSAPNLSDWDVGRCVVYAKTSIITGLVQKRTYLRTRPRTGLNVVPMESPYATSY